MVTVKQFCQTYVGVECWSGVESNFGVANVFCSIHQNIAGHMNTSKECARSKPSVVFCQFRQDQSFLPLQNLTPLHSNTPLQYSAP